MTVMQSGDALMSNPPFAARLGFKLGANGCRYPVKGTAALRTGWIYGRASVIGDYIAAYTEATDAVIADNTVTATLRG